MKCNREDIIHLLTYLFFLEQPPNEMPQDYQSLAHPLVNDLTDDSIRNSNLDNEQLNQNNHIERETIGI